MIADLAPVICRDTLNAQEIVQIVARRTETR